MARKMGRIVLGCVVALYFLAQLFVSLTAMAQGIAPLAENPNRSYDGKMRLQLGEYYELLKFVQDKTPSDATILIDSPSHAQLDLYFLYPRRIFYDRDLTARMQSVDYIVLTGEMPLPFIQGTRIMLDTQRGMVRFR